MIKKQLPPIASKKRVLVQALVSKDIVDEVKAIKKGTGWTWDQIITVYCKDFIKEMKGDNK